MSEYAKSMLDVFYVLAEEMGNLKTYTTRLTVAGSIRRCKEDPHDIDLVAIPINIDNIKLYAKCHNKGKIGIGNSHVSYNVKGIEIQVFFATEDTWGAMMLKRTGPAGYIIGLSCVAKKLGYKLNEYGLWDKNNRCIASQTERDIYTALGKEWKTPHLRGK